MSKSKKENKPESLVSQIMGVILTCFLGTMGFVGLVIALVIVFGAGLFVAIPGWLSLLVIGLAWVAGGWWEYHGVKRDHKSRG